MFEIKFNNEVTVFFQWEDYQDSKTIAAGASHPAIGNLKVTGFENRYKQEIKEGVIPLKSEELSRFLAKACSMRFTEKGEQCIAFFDF